MPPRKGSEKIKRSKKSKKSKKQPKPKRISERIIYVPVVHYHRRPKRPSMRPHHYSYSFHPGHEHLHNHINRVNYSSNTSELSQQDLIQRQLKENTDSYIPNFMHVSSDELAIPPPYLKRNGMRMFASA